MNVTDVANRVKRTFGDEAAVQITDTDIIRWINDAQEKIVLENRGLMESTGTANVVAGTADYTAPTDLLDLRSLLYKGFRVKAMSFAEFNEYLDGFRAPASTSPYSRGIPEIFMVWNNTITLFPTPNESITDGLTIYYLRHPAQVATLADNLSVPLEYHNSIVDFCLSQAYELDEDFQKAGYKASQFNDDVTKLNDQKKWTAREYYPRITTLPEDETYGDYGYWGGYY